MKQIYRCGGIESEGEPPTEETETRSINNSNKSLLGK